MKFLVIGDVHLADRGPRSRTLNYRSLIEDKLRFCIDLANDEKVDAVLQLGDFFHIKTPNRNSHAMVQEAAKILARASCPVIINPGNHDACVTTDTEALTDQGWRTVHSLTGEEKFATLDPKSNEMVFQKPSGINLFNYSGDAYHFKSQSCDLITTPNHRWYGTTSNKNTTVNIRTSEEWSKRPTTLRLLHNSPVETPTPTCFTLGDRTWDSLLFARFLGWYVAEGTADLRSNRINISQSLRVNPDHYEEICSIITEMGLTCNRGEKRIRFSDKPLADFLKEEFGRAGSIDMRLPRWLIDSGRDFLTEFLWAYFRGDGTINGSREERELADYSKSTVHARTANPSLGDDLMEVGVRLGYRVTHSPMKEFPYGNSGYVGKAMRISYINKNKNINLPKPTKERVTNVEMWCPTLPNGTWLARRNGRTIWTGNSNDRHEDLHRQPLGTLGLHPNIEILIGPHAHFPIWGQPYFDLSPDNYKYWLDRYHADSGPEIYPILMAHNSIFPEKEIPPYDNVSAEVWAETFKAPYTFYGHIHEPMDAGWNYQIGGTHFLNNGSISRGSLAERNLVRKPQVTIFDDSKKGNPFTSVEVPHLPASEVFFLAESILAKEQQASVDEFLSTLEGGELSYLTTESILEDARNRKNLTKDALAILEDIVETVT